MLYAAFQYTSIALAISILINASSLFYKMSVVYINIVKRSYGKIIGNFLSLNFIQTLFAAVA